MDCDYQGQSFSLGPGSYNMHPDHDKKLSSIMIPNGFRVILYENKGLQGRNLWITGNAPCLIRDGFNDITSSFKIERI